MYTIFILVIMLDDGQLFSAEMNHHSCSIYAVLTDGSIHLCLIRKRGHATLKTLIWLL
jgi:hypothetical protein